MIDLRADIEFILRAHAFGKSHAMTKETLQSMLRDIGRTVSLRTLRREYAEIKNVGYVISGPRRGLFWISTPEEAREVEALRRGQGISCLVHAAETRGAQDKAEQGSLFEEAL